MIDESSLFYYQSDQILVSTMIGDDCFWGGDDASTDFVIWVKISEGGELCLIDEYVGQLIWG